MFPYLSTVTITYNHEKWIGRTIEGFLAQETTFPVEMIIAEDCSTDETRAICEQYATAHPDKIRLLPSEKNLGALQNERRAMAAAPGKYIAFCEGDDYWTDPQKLQKQVDFLEAHPDYSICFTRFSNYDEENGTLRGCEADRLFSAGQTAIDISIDDFFNGWYLQPLTMIFRTDALEIDWYDRYKYFRDYHLIYHLMKKGKCRLFSFNGGIRTCHSGGMASKISSLDYCRISLPMDREFYLKTRDKGPRKQYIETLQASIPTFAAHRKRCSAIASCFKIFCITHRPGTLLRNLRKAFQ